MGSLNETGIRLLLLGLMLKGCPLRVGPLMGGLDAEVRSQRGCLNQEDRQWAA